MEGLICLRELSIARTMTSNISRSALLYYIEHEQVAFQFGDGLMTFTHTCDDEEKNEMYSFVSEASKIKEVSAFDVITVDDKYGFNEFAKWSQSNDTLLLVDDSLLLCLPSSVNIIES